MERQEVIETLKRLKNSNKRNFKQSIELIINLKGIDLKKQDNQINLFVSFPYSWGKKVSVCAFVGPELQKQAEGICEEVIKIDDFPKYKDKKLIKKLAKKHDFFIAQANIMPQIAANFGRVLGPLAKMPNPKIGCVLPPNANIKPVYEKLQKTKRLLSRSNPIIQCSIGIEDMNENEIADNVMAVYNTLIPALPNEKHNIKDAYLKLTMSNAFMIGEKEEKEIKEKPKEKKEEKIIEKTLKKEIKEKEPIKKESIKKEEKLVEEKKKKRQRLKRNQ